MTLEINDQKSQIILHTGQQVRMHIIFLLQTPKKWNNDNSKANNNNTKANNYYTKAKANDNNSKANKIYHPPIFRKYSQGGGQLLSISILIYKNSPPAYKIDINLDWKKIHIITHL